MFSFLLHIEQEHTNTTGNFSRLDEIFFYIDLSFFMSFSSRNFGFYVPENQFIKTSFVNLNSIENSSVRGWFFTCKHGRSGIFQLGKSRFIKKWNVLLLEVTKVVYFQGRLLKTSEFHNFLKIYFRLKCIDLAVAYNEHFRLKKESIASSGFKVNINCKWHIT